MIKKLVLTSIIASGLFVLQSTHAHNEVEKYEDSETKQKLKEEKDAKNSWDDFMKQVKEQDDKKQEKSSEYKDHH